MGLAGPKTRRMFASELISALTNITGIQKKLNHPVVTVSSFIRVA